MKKSENFEWYLVFAYDCVKGRKGEIFSRHKTYESAHAKSKASCWNDFLAIRHRYEIKIA